MTANPKLSDFKGRLSFRLDFQGSTFLIKKPTTTKKAANRFYRV